MDNNQENQEAEVTNQEAASVEVKNRKTIAFHFRAELIKDDKGNVLEKKEKHPSVNLTLNTLEAEDLLAIVQAGGKELELLLESVNDVIYQEARSVVADALQDKKAVDQALIDANADKLSWIAIANKPKAERKGNGISTEVWDAFAEDYKTVMATVQPDKTAEQIATAATHISKKFANCRFNKPVIATLRSYVAAWFVATPNQEDFGTVYEALEQRAETLLNADEAGKLAEAI